MKKVFPAIGRKGAERFFEYSCKNYLNYDRLSKIDFDFSKYTNYLE